MDSLKKILLIDDDQQFEDAIRTSFAPEKYNVISAPTCISGIQKVFQHHPDLILYNINLDPLEGSELFKALQLTSTFGHIPVVFYKDKNGDEIKYVLNNNGNSDFLKSPFPNKFLPPIEDRAKGPSNPVNKIVYDFNTLFHLIPNGMFIFDKYHILSANQMLMKLLERNRHDFSTIKMEELFDQSSIKAIKQWMKKISNGDTTTFTNQVFIKDKSGENIIMNLMVSEFKKEGSSVHYLGILQAPQGNNLMVNYQLANEVCNLLKRENITVSVALEKKITQTIKQRIIGDTHQKKSFFTKREDEVLRLSMEGLSIKVIADKLALSTRTVEKYRTKLMLKSGAKNIVEVIVFSLKNNLVKI